MGFLDRFRTTRPAKDGVASDSASFATWVDPPVAPASEEWELRLNAYARKSAGILHDAGVPLFRSQWPWDGEATFRDAFWMIACDVDVAERVWVANALQFRAAKRLPGRPPPRQERDFDGWLLGRALLLTSSGILCVADAGGKLTRTGDVDDHEMDMSFRNIDRPVHDFRSHDWGWSNHGRWRRNPKEDLNTNGLDIHKHAIRFESRLSHPAPYPEDGRDTSAALTHFVKTNGNVRWPRGFISFHY